MKNLKSIFTVAAIAILATVFNSCQKDEIFPIGNENEVAGQSVWLKSGVTITYLEDLIAKIEFLVSEGTLSEGTGNSLIAKVENAIRSVQNGNLNAFKGQLNAVINQVEGLIERGVLTPEQGQPLIDAAESELILADGYFVDPRDGEKYTVVQIGTQLWMAENLRAIQYTDGTGIPEVTDDSEWGGLTSNAYCWFQNDGTSYKEIAGALYNWYTVSPDNNGGKKLCPVGWSVPTFNDWNELINYLKINSYGLDEDPSAIAKSMAATTGWSLSMNYGTPGYNQQLNNKSGFTGFPTGMRNYNGMFFGLGGYANWWSSSDYPKVGYVWIAQLNKLSPYCSQPGYAFNYGLSIRCIKN